MIDKNDVKMPERKDRTGKDELDESQIQQIRQLLDLVNGENSKRELRLGAEYYNNFHWFGQRPGERPRSFFSYQHEAVYNFMFDLNKSGILSDQVGMGKTIEAGMIISELASRHELRSLLIVVPNEIMATKWEDELRAKFGINSYNDQKTSGNRDQIQEEYPKKICSYEDFCKCVWTCIEEKYLSQDGKSFWEQFRHTYKPSDGNTYQEVIFNYLKADIKSAVKKINDSLDITDIFSGIEFDGKKFILKTNDGSTLSADYIPHNDKTVYDSKSGQPIKPLDLLFFHDELKDGFIGQSFENDFSTYICALKNELEPLMYIIGDYALKYPNVVSAALNINREILNKYPLLIIPISYSQKTDEGYVQKEFLNRILRKGEPSDHKLMCVGDEYSVSEQKADKGFSYENYRIIDFFIDAHYQTLIVDEVHDYINVEKKINREEFHSLTEDAKYSPENPDAYSPQIYNRYELFDDYYFIRKSSLFKKLKELSDMADRKIFLTATPIKSDMVDFYLLTLIASNKDSEKYRNIGYRLLEALNSPKQQNPKDTINMYFTYSLFKAYVLRDAAAAFMNNASEFLKLANEEDEHVNRNEKLPFFRYKYPYFNNSYLLENLNNEQRIRDYLIDQINYMTVYELMIELIIAYNEENGSNATESSGIGDFDVRGIVKDLESMFTNPYLNEQKTARIVFRALLNNTVRMRFEDDFTIEIKKGKTEDDKSSKDVTYKPIKRIRELLDLENGPRLWNKTYSKYGIRHTRHQTYKLEKEYRDKLNPKKRDAYENLPIWPRRNGRMLYLLRDDNFFDCYITIKRDYKATQNLDIKLEQLPNKDNLVSSEAEQKAKFNDATAMFDYINKSMTGELKEIRYRAEKKRDEDMTDYKLVLVTKLMLGNDTLLGNLTDKVLLFAENDRDRILAWFAYLKYLNEKAKNNSKISCPVDDDLKAEFDKLLDTSFSQSEKEDVVNISRIWETTDDAVRLQNAGHQLIVIDPMKYEKGVDLQKADTIINFDISYDPLKMEQRIGRIDRIRPDNSVRGIHIISFVPYNDMSGYIINFFANELQLFTQWMGETTGIVSVTDDKDEKGAVKVSFEDKVLMLEKFYKYLYDLCMGKKVDIDRAIKDFRDFFKLNEAERYQYKYDFQYIQAVCGIFDKAFKNCVTPCNEGINISGGKGKVVRFNSALPLNMDCAAAQCNGCPNKKICEGVNNRRNSGKEFKKAVAAFYDKTKEFYEYAFDDFNEEIKNKTMGSASDNSTNQVSEYLRRRMSDAVKDKEEVVAGFALIDDNAPFTMEFGKFNAIFGKLKALLWDSVVKKYMDLIMERFYKQCDSVLQGADMFARFIKTFSIAEFMNSMDNTEGADNGN